MRPPTTQARRTQHGRIQPLGDDVGIDEDPRTDDAPNHHHGGVEGTQGAAEAGLTSGLGWIHEGSSSSHVSRGRSRIVGGWRPLDGKDSSGRELSRRSCGDNLLNPSKRCLRIIEPRIHPGISEVQSE